MMKLMHHTTVRTESGTERIVGEAWVFGVERSAHLTNEMLGKPVVCFSNLQCIGLESLVAQIAGQQRPECAPKVSDAPRVLRWYPPTIPFLSPSCAYKQAMISILFPNFLPPVQTPENPDCRVQTVQEPHFPSQPFFYPNSVKLIALPFPPPVGIPRHPSISLLGIPAGLVMANPNPPLNSQAAGDR